MTRTELISYIEKIIAEGPFSASWDSLEEYCPPKWLNESKLGIFIHWGVYSVPAFENEWYPRNMYINGSKAYEHHIKTYGAQFGYKDFVPMFKAEKFDPADWADLFKKSGAKYVVPVAEHHDGFKLYGSDLTPWNAEQMGPKRNLVKELSDEVRKQGMIFGVSNHRAENIWFFDGGLRYDCDVSRGECPGLYNKTQPKEPYCDMVMSPPTEEHLLDWLITNCELVLKLKPQIVWFDWWIHNLAFKPYLKKFAAFYYNMAAKWGKEVMINYKHEAFPLQTAVFDMERGQLDGIRPLPWQTDTAVAKNSWCYTENNEYKEPNDILCDFVDIISKNGALLLNIGPKADGTIPDEDRRILLEIGKWMERNGEAVYGSCYCSRYGEGPTEIVGGTFNDTKRQPFTPKDMRFTKKDGNYYVFLLKWPSDGKAAIESMGISRLSTTERFSGFTNYLDNGLVDKPVQSVSLLGDSGKVIFSQQEDALHIDLSNCQKCDYPAVLKIIV